MTRNSVNNTSTTIQTNTNTNTGNQPLVSRRRGLGRSSRRRRQKLMEILRAEESQSQSKQDDTTTSTTTSTIIPTDRHRVWPGVQERRRQLKLTSSDPDDWAPSDAARLLSQLGYLPGNALSIAARAEDLSMSMSNLDLTFCHPEDPMVLLLYPVAVREENHQPRGKFKRRNRKRQQPQPQLQTPLSNDQPTAGTTTSSSDLLVVEPFPTLYWLTLPRLRTLVSKLELQGMGVLLEQRLANDPEASTRMQKAHSAYGQERYKLLVDTDLQYIEKRNWQAAFDPARGVAGIRNPLAVKCLHAHVAHYLSGGHGSDHNVIGQWVMEIIVNEMKHKKDVQAADDGQVRDPS